MDHLAALVERHSTGFGSRTAIPRQTLVALDEARPVLDVVYAPMICFVVGGSKRSFMGERTWEVRAGDMFLNSVTVPVTARFETLPYRSVVLHLEHQQLIGVLDEAEEDESAEVRSTARTTPEIADALTRWVNLLETPRDIRALAGRFEQEILYRLLTSPLGPALRQWSRSDTAAARIRQAAAWITEHFAEPMAVEDLAARAVMSPASLHRHFRSATGMTPLQFQKRLRLQEARRLMLNGEGTAAQTAQAVGYASANQFNREYRRFYGLPPRQDTALLVRRAENQPSIDSSSRPRSSSI